MATLSTFEELACWKAGREFRRFVSGLLKRFPSHEMDDLTLQLRKSSRSVTHNIAEGIGRWNAQDNARFCRISRGSLCEALDQLVTAHDDEYITDGEMAQGRELFDRVRAPLEGYITYLTGGREDSNLKEPAGEYRTTWNEQ